MIKHKVMAGLAAVSALTMSGRAAADMVFELKTNQLPFPSALAKHIETPTGQIDFTLSNGQTVNVPPWKSRALLISGASTYPLQEALFTTKPFKLADYGSILTIWEGIFFKQVKRMDFALVCAGNNVAGFYAKDGKLVLTKYNTPDFTFGTYTLTHPENGVQKSSVHSAIVLVDLKKKTFRITWMQDGESVTTGTRPFNNPNIDMTGTSRCELHAIFWNPNLDNRYMINNVGIAANK